MKTLFCFPFAGGNSYSYRGLPAVLPGIDVKPLELPGRGRRSTEPLCREIHLMADDLFSQIEPHAQGSYALFGHSMGACLALLVARQLIGRSLPSPVALFVSGRNAISSTEPAGRHLLPKAEFTRLLAGLGGCPPAILADREMLDYFEPIIRADFEAHGRLRPDRALPLDLPIVVLSGESDANVNPAGLAQWQECTTCPLDLHILPGGHFYLFEQWPAVGRIIRERWSALANQQTPVSRSNS